MGTNRERPSVNQGHAYTLHGLLLWQILRDSKVSQWNLKVSHFFHTSLNNLVFSQPFSSSHFKKP